MHLVHFLSFHYSLFTGAVTDGLCSSQLVSKTCEYLLAYLHEDAAMNVHINPQKEGHRFMFPGGETETYGATRTKARHVTEMSATCASAALFPSPTHPIYLHSDFCHISQERPGNSRERLLRGSPRSILRVHMNEGTWKK